VKIALHDPRCEGNALVANVNSRSGNQLRDLIFILPAE
jgi:hypothetical protein